MLTILQMLAVSWCCHKYLKWTKIEPGQKCSFCQHLGHGLDDLAMHTYLGEFFPVPDQPASLVSPATGDQCCSASTEKQWRGSWGAPFTFNFWLLNKWQFSVSCYVGKVNYYIHVSTWLKQLLIRKSWNAKYLNFLNMSTPGLVKQNITCKKKEL